MAFQQIRKEDLEYQEIKNNKKDWVNQPGVYLMIFPNGMKYLGKSNHLGKRLISHISGFKKGEKWYGAARQQICQKEEPSFYDCWEGVRDNVDYYIQILPAGTESEVEAKYLKEIQMNFRTDEYYNTAYPTLTEEDWMVWMFGSEKND